MACNLCGSSEFLDFNGRSKIRCKVCGSSERARLLWLYLETYGSLGPDSRVLHIAPERCIYDRLVKILASDNYHVRDFNPAGYPFAKNISKIDLCNLDELPDDYYDVVVHSHVLEHVRCNIAHPLFHLHRALKPSGRHFFLVPFLGGKYDECFQDIGDQERIRRFGQNDHVRRFGREDIETHLGKLVKLEEAGMQEAVAAFPEELLESYNIPRGVLTSFTAHTVLNMGKTGMHFFRP